MLPDTRQLQILRSLPQPRWALSELSILRVKIVEDARALQPDAEPPALRGGSRRVGNASGARAVNDVDLQSSAASF